jgi:signal transduction histidine kinase
MSTAPGTAQNRRFDFEIEPAFWQTPLFHVGVAFALVAVVAVLYRFRLHQLTKQLNFAFEERLAERTHIAQELHDTLLQGFLSASMQLQVVADRLPSDSPLAPGLARVTQLMRQVIDEGRNALRGLRSTHAASLDLEQAFSRIEQDLAVPATAEFRVIVEGQPRDLHPVMRDEVFRIGREAVMNAFRHSGAKSIEVELEYAAKQLRLLVRDNGCGIDPELLRAGREGHWGLPGMRERAERIGGQLRVWSSAAAGTEIELSVPRHLAYQRPARRKETPT